jgi:sorbitol/mannitol transport system substrate-binding protein
VVSKGIFLGAALVALSSTAHAATTLTIATVNNADMIRMQQLTPEFKATNPDIDVNWVVLEENILRQKVTTDIATDSGQYDILTIGNYEVPIWAKAKWLLPLDNLGSKYDLDDLLPKVRASLSYEDQLFAAPFYAEASMTYYRKDLFDKAGLKMPELPTWDFIKEAAGKITDKDNGVYGICLRGKAGWGENINFITAMANSYGARWFDENWKPQFDQPAWKETITDYVSLMRDFGPPGASSNGATQALSLFATGKCGIFIDATVFASLLSDPKQSEVSKTVGFAHSPTKGLSKSAVTLWAWALAIPASTKQKDAAEKFIAWATSKEYTDLVASKYGIVNAPPATRASLYKNEDYLKVAPFAQLTLNSIQDADPEHPTVDPVPYVGVQFVSIPEFQAIGTNVGQQFSAAVAGSADIDQVLKTSQTLTERTMKQAGYPK